MICREVCAEEGITVKTAMFADINLVFPWDREMLCSQNGVEFFIPISTHHGMYPLYQNQKPYFWENEDGQRLLVWMAASIYNLGNALGIVFNKNVNFMTANYFGRKHRAIFARAAGEAPLQPDCKHGGI